MASIPLRRLLAFAIDWLVLAIWAGLVFGAVMLATGGNPAPPSGPWRAQATGFLAMTLPFILYFALCESSAMRASLGKRTLGLAVTSEEGARLPLGRALVRNAVKLAPWELGHTVANQAAFSGEGAPPAWVWLPLALSLIGPLWWVVSMFASGDTPYDRWASARVQKLSG